ncbi:MAG: DUF4856 domain-containing protein [Salinibacter sp.]
MQRFPYSRSLSSLLFVPLLALGLILTGCDSGGSMEDGEEPDDTIEVPNAYAFESPFVDGESAVAYPGQVTRNLLISDLKTLTDGRGPNGSPSSSDLFDRYEYDSQDLDVLLGTDPSPLQTQYSDIATGKSLKGKATAPYSDQGLIGIGDVPGFSSGATPDDVITTYLDNIATNYADGQEAPEAYTTDENVEMSQIVNKLLLGAVAYSQGTAKYLDDVLNTGDSPNAQDGENPYSTLGHVWDEAFGYFGAAREFDAFFDSNGIENALDRNGDGQIDFASEYVYTWADYAYDRGSVGGDFHLDAWQAFLEGRTAIINQESEQTIRDHADDARLAWEKVVAANTIHYLNSMESDLSALADDDAITESNLGQDTAEAFNVHWGEAKPFAWALQFNSDKEISDQQLEDLHAALGGTPPYGETKADAVSDIETARTILQDAYGFSDSNVANW